MQARVGKEPHNPAKTSTLGPELSEAAGRRERLHVPPPSLQSAQKKLMPTSITPQPGSLERKGHSLYPPQSSFLTKAAQTCLGSARSSESKSAAAHRQTSLRPDYFSEVFKYNRLAVAHAQNRSTRRLRPLDSGAILFLTPLNKLPSSCSVYKFYFLKAYLTFHRIFLCPTPL